MFAILDDCRSSDRLPRHDTCQTAGASQGHKNGFTPREHAKFVKTPFNKTMADHIKPLILD